MYESPITLMVQKMAEQVAKELDEATFKAVELVMPTVNQEELIRALKYDREQYDKGYTDGKRDAMNELVRCKDCKHSFEDDFDSSWWCCRDKDREVVETHFCSYGERKEADGDG